MPDDTYRLVESPDGTPGISCDICGMTSFHPGDIMHRYCGACKRYHGALYALPEHAFAPAGLWVRAHAARPLPWVDAEFMLVTGVRFYGRYVRDDLFSDGEAFDGGPLGRLSYHLVSFWRPVSAK